MAESGSLENCCPGNGTVGSIPTLSAKTKVARAADVPGASVLFIWFVLFVWFEERKKPNEPDRPD